MRNNKAKEFFLISPKIFVIFVMFFVGVFLVLLPSFSMADILSVTLNSPANNTWLKEHPTFNFTAVSNSDPVFTCNLLVDGTIVATNDSTKNNTLTSLVPIFGLQEGMHRWNITCSDTLGRLTSETRTLYIDTETPNVSLISPSDGANLSSTSVDFKFKVIDNLDSSLSCSLYVDGDKEKDGNVNNNSEVTWTLTLTREEHDWQVKCKDNANNEGSSETREFTIEKIGFCKYGEQGDLAISIDSPDSGDEFYAGDNVSVRVNVENNYNDDLDIIIKAGLYDLDDEDDVVSTSYETTIREDDEKTYTLYLKIPGNIDVDHDYVIRVKVYEEGNEDDQCKEDSVDIELNQKKHNVVINSFSLSAMSVECGKSFSANFGIENTGSSDEDIRITIRNLALGINYMKELSLDSGDEYAGTATFSVPSNATETEYEIVLTVYYNLYDDTYNSQTSKTETLLVKGNCFVKPIEEKDAIVSAQQISDAFNGKEFAIKVTVTNTGNVVTTYTINASEYGTWATLSRIDPSVLNLDSGETGYAYVYLVPLENASGANNLKIKVTFESTTKEVPVTVNIKKQTFSAPWLDQIFFEIKSNLTWFIVDFVLVIAIVVLVIFLIRERLKNRYLGRSEISEIKVRTINDKELRRLGKKK